MPKTLTPMLTSYQSPRGARLAAVITLLALLLLLSTALVYSSGGTSTAYLHLAYLPIVLAAFLLYRWGGLITGIVAGLLLGPLMPLDVAAGAAQDPLNWLLRLVIFALVGAFTGQLIQLLSKRSEWLAHSYAQTMHGFASLIAGRDEQVAGHCERVASNARQVGRELGVDEGDLDALYWAGILHDLGKVAIPDRILLKNGPLNDEEYQQVKAHCDLGADLVARGGEEYELVASGVRCHHERWDGTGYPAGLQGSAIPLFGRILGVVDVFEALTSERPYRKPVGVAAACELLRRESGGHFDPRVVQTFLDLLDRGRIEVALAATSDAIPELQADEGG